MLTTWSVRESESRAAGIAKAHDAYDVKNVERAGASTARSATGSRDQKND
jgi:hypothetical protein